MKINTGSIAGYAEMTPEQKIAALEAYEVSEPDYSGYVRKDVFDRTASELAEKKKQLNERKSEEERKADEHKERMEDLQSKYDALLKKSTLSEHKARLLALGYDEALATETAEAMFAGDTDKVFAAQQRHLDAMGKKIREEAMQGTPRPTGGSGKPKSAEDIWNISDHAERQAAIAENIDLFEQ